MDPITGVGLVASVVQLLTFGIDTVKTCQELYQKGSVSEYKNLGYTTSHLAGLNSSLQQSLQSSNARSGALTGEEKDLIDLARKCEECATKLQKKLDKLQTQPRASTPKAVRLAFRAIRKKGAIDKINQELQAYQSTLDTSLLTRLSQRFDTQGLQNDQAFANLDRNLQHIITRLGNGHPSLNDLVVQESAQTRQCTTAQIDRVERLHKENQRYEEIVNSLFYPDISSRQEQVDSLFDGIKNTYDWIFDDPQTHRMPRYDEGYSRQEERRWDDFARWLKSGHGVYWINGKAGSGKSTLMNHICNHSRTLELLREWCSDRRLLTPTFFFWNAGNRLQKSIDGLLRSLVYQMLKECRELVACFSNEPLHTWTQSRLLATLLKLLKQSQTPLAICIFIDGLDEFEGQEDTAIKMIDDLADQTHVKVCVSSRPLLTFEEAFDGKPNLRLQDLTFGSMMEYGKVKLSEPIQKYVSDNMCKRYQAEFLVEKIVERAHGVFLWAIIVTKNVHNGLRGRANISELEKTLETLPSQLGDLFMVMLQRIEPVFKPDAAYFLQIAMYQNTSNVDDHVDLCRLHFSYSQRELKDRPARYEDIATSELVTACRTLKTRLLSHTAGLLELRPSYYPLSIYGERKDHDPILSLSMNFLHRTARDFLLENDGAKSFLARNGSSEAQVRLSIARGTFAQLAHLSQGNAKIVDNGGFNPVYGPFRTILEQISVAERLLGKAQTNLMQSLNYKSLARGYQTFRNSLGRLCEAFLIDEQHANSIDQVGMAANVGMTRYVCEQLDIPFESRSCSSSFPDLNDYSRSKRTVATLTWSEFSESPNQNIDIAVLLRSSKYRQALGQCLQCKSDDQWSSQMEGPSQNNVLAESYMLCCCGLTCPDLVRILLRAGANPMVRFEERFEEDLNPCFWNGWLHSLLAWSDDKTISKKDTLKDVIDITKDLLVNGADVNYLITFNSTYFLRLIKRARSHRERFSFSLTRSAMFILEELFNSEAEFRRFASEIEPLVKRPTTKFIKIKPNNLSYEVSASIVPSAEESEMLWPLLEKWKDTGRRDDRDAIDEAFEGVWRAHNPGVELRRTEWW